MDDSMLLILKSYRIGLNQAPMLLEKYGYTFPSPLGTWKKLTGPVCPLCFGYYTMEDKNGRYVYCICKLEEWLEEHKKSCQLFETPMPAMNINDLKPFWNKKSEEIGKEDLENLLSYVKKWMKLPNRWMWIEGGLGTGKTHLLAAIKTTMPAITFYISAERFASECFRTMKHEKIFEGGDQITLDDFISSLSTVPILLFDDWGLEHRSSFVTDQLAAVINNRYRMADEFLTVITSNMKLGKLVETKDSDLAIARIASRMSDSQICDFFRLRQADFRRADTHVYA